jgi:hypothetical protein
VLISIFYNTRPEIRINIVYTVVFHAPDEGLKLERHSWKFPRAAADSSLLFADDDAALNLL